MTQKGELSAPGVISEPNIQNIHSQEKNLIKVLSRIEIIQRTNVQRPGSMKVFFSTKLSDFKIKSTDDSFNQRQRKPSLNTTKEKIFSRENTLNQSKFEGFPEINNPSDHQKQKELSFNISMHDKPGSLIRDQLNNQVDMLTNPVDEEGLLGGVDQWLQRFSRNGDVDMGRLADLERLGEDQFLLLNMKYHEDLKRSIEVDHLDEYVFSKNHSINLAYDCESIESAIPLISQFDCFINLQKKEGNLMKFYSCFALQVIFWIFVIFRC